MNNFEYTLTNDQINELQSRYLYYQIKSLKKEITFFYQNQSELDLMTPVIEEARQRGYICSSTDNITEKAVP